MSDSIDIPAGCFMLELSVVKQLVIPCIITAGNFRSKRRSFLSSTDLMLNKTKCEEVCNCI